MRGADGVGDGIDAGDGVVREGLATVSRARGTGVAGGRVEPGLAATFGRAAAALGGSGGGGGTVFVADFDGTRVTGFGGFAGGAVTGGGGVGGCAGGDPDFAGNNGDVAAALGLDRALG
ncbi:MAG: hypothetical protein JNK85_12700 [Verrucomicrobiales bacterium]|nr:hypothetical protein [Verrucomicrobiales bacterium]